MPSTFLEATLRDRGWVDPRFWRGVGGGRADVRLESVKGDRIPARFVFRGILDETIPYLRASIDKAFGPIEHEFHDAAHLAWGGRLTLPSDGLLDPALRDLLMGSGWFGTPWLRFLWDRVELRAPVDSSPAGREAAERLASVVHSRDPEASVFIGPLSDEAAAVWAAMVKSEAEAAEAGTVPLPPRAPVSSFRVRKAHDDVIME